MRPQRSRRIIGTPEVPFPICILNCGTLLLEYNYKEYVVTRMTPKNSEEAIRMGLEDIESKKTEISTMCPTALFCSIWQTILRAWLI